MKEKQRVNAGLDYGLGSKKYKLCCHCGQPMKPKGVRKKKDFYDHAFGCPLSRKKK